MSALPTETRFRIDGMDCAGCATKIEGAVRRLPGVVDVGISVMSSSLTLRHEAEADLAAVERRVSGLGYGISRAVAGAAKPALSPVGHGRNEPGHAHDHSAHDHGDHEHDSHGHSHGHSHDHAQDSRRPMPSAPANLRPTAQAAGSHHGHSHGGHGHDHGAAGGPWWRSVNGIALIASAAGFAVAYGVSTALPAVGPWAFTAAMLVGLAPIARRAAMAALAGMPFTIETLLTVAAVGAVLIGAAEEAAAVVVLFLVGEMLEGLAAGRARAGIQALANLVPRTALLETAGGTETVPADALAVGQVIVVRPGERMPADGIVVSGASAVDEAPVTGESTPVSKGPDAAVFAGTVNGDGVLRVKVSAAAQDNTIARIVRLVEEAQESKAPTERFIDRFARIYTPGVLAAGALVAVVPPLLFGGMWSEWIYKGLAVLLIGCPCALVISTPAAIAASLATGARRGLLLKGGAVLEAVGGITTVAFDKTGTLTRGKPVVTDMIAYDRPELETLRLAAAVEAGSSHPLAAAILAKAREAGLPIVPAQDARALGGRGVEGSVDGMRVVLASPSAAAELAALSEEQSAGLATWEHDGKTVAVLVVDGRVAAALAMRDEPRADAREALARLAAMKIRTVMLTGDNPRTANAVGAGLGIEVRAGLLPQDKQRIVAELQASGERVAKVGDGINDAPALAAADVGIAMGGGTDVALETADAAALHARVGDVPDMILLSRRTMGNIRQNITIALGLKAVFLVTTIAGVTGLWPAILADTGATVLVTANAMRLLRPPSPPRA